jgi:hypothetical protein
MIPRRVPILPPEQQRHVDGELRPGERLIWAAQPRPGAYRRQSLGLVLFGIPWTAFAIFWMVTAGWGASKLERGPFSYFALLGLPFVFIGFGMLSSPLWLTRKAKRTVYAVTDQRVIVFEGGVFGGIKVQTFMPDRLTSMTRNQRSDGSGDLIFEEFRERRGSGTHTVRRGFVGIKDVREVEELINATLVAKRTRPMPSASDV